MSKLTSTTAQRFRRGQIEILRAKEHDVLRGEIQDIVVHGSGVHAYAVITLAWMARGDCPPVPGRWTHFPLTRYEMNLAQFSDVFMPRNRLHFHSQTVGHSIMLIPSGDRDILDRSEMPGLL